MTRFDRGQRFDPGVIIMGCWVVGCFGDGLRTEEVGTGKLYGLDQAFRSSIIKGPVMVLKFTSTNFVIIRKMEVKTWHSSIVYQGVFLAML